MAPIFAPQLILGFAFSWGVLLADAVLNGNISTSTIIMYFATVAWVVTYDSIYAYQDYEDDKKVGIYSTALLMGEKPMPYIYILYAILALGLFFSGINIIFLLVAFLYVFLCLRNLNYKDTPSCFNFFKQNVYFAIIIWLGYL